MIIQRCWLRWQRVVTSVVGRTVQQQMRIRIQTLKPYRTLRLQPGWWNVVVSLATDGGSGDGWWLGSWWWQWKRKVTMRRDRPGPAALRRATLRLRTCSAWPNISPRGGMCIKRCEHQLYISMVGGKQCGQARVAHALVALVKVVGIETCGARVE